MSNRRSTYLTAGCTAATLDLAALGAPRNPWIRAQVITPEQLAKELREDVRPGPLSLGPTSGACHLLRPGSKRR